MKKVLIVFPVDADLRKRFSVLEDSYSFTFKSKNEVSEEDLADTQILFGNLSPEQVSGMKALELLQLESAGYDPYVVPGIVPEGTPICNVGPAYGACVGEHMIAMAFALAKNLHTYHSNQLQQKWMDAGPVLPLRGLTVLVLGTGAIGGTCAQIMHGLGNKVIGFKRSLSSPPAYLDEVHTLDELEQYLPCADMIFCALPASAGTKNVFGEKQFRLMKSTALLINAGRGSLIDTDALVEALREGEIGGAGLDVTDPEPLPPEHPLWKADNAMITPHISGGFRMPGPLEFIIDLGISNLQRLAAGEELQYRVN